MSGDHDFTYSTSCWFSLKVDEMLVISMEKEVTFLSVFYAELTVCCFLTCVFCLFSNHLSLQYVYCPYVVLAEVIENQNVI